VGRAAELYVAFDLVRRGFDAVINSFPGSAADVLVPLPSGVTLRVQVKATWGAEIYNQHRERRSLRYSFTMAAGTPRDYASEVDILAFTVLEIPMVLYVPSSEMERKAHKRFSAERFVARAPGSLERVLEEGGLSH